MVKAKNYAQFLLEIKCTFTCFPQIKSADYVITPQNLCSLSTKQPLHTHTMLAC